MIPMVLRELQRVQVSDLENTILLKKHSQDLNKLKSLILTIEKLNSSKNFMDSGMKF
jgi:hypothetical protein